MLFKDPKMAKQVAGHAPGRRPLHGPYRVEAVRGNKADIRCCDSGCLLRDIHGDFLICIPGDTTDLELPPSEAGPA